MAALSQAERAKVARWFMRSAGLGSCSFTKLDLYAAVDATDDWAEAQAAEFNAALPQPFRGAASPDQKALLLAIDILVRYGGDLGGIGGD